jgi:hypothetical protein
LSLEKLKNKNYEKEKSSKEINQEAQDGKAKGQEVSPLNVLIKNNPAKRGVVFYYRT